VVINEYHKEGGQFTVKATAPIANRSLLVVGDAVGVVIATASGLPIEPIGGAVEVSIEGVYRNVPKNTGTGTGTVQGTKIYYDASTQKVTAISSGGNKLIGYAHETCSDTATTCMIQLIMS
jgi:predicted RecA/RadA family phage recombinase